MKYFMSFLGTGKYQPCHYAWPNGQSPEVRYVQTASLMRTGAVDRVLIFCTQGAKAVHFNGLCEEFAKNGLPLPTCIDIVDGLDEEGMWSIFSKVIENVPENVEIVFDATHSFRSLSVIMSIILNYLKVVRAAVLNACYYGAWEARDANGNVAPLVDLNPFFELNDWTIAVRDFTKLGDAKLLNRLAVNSLLPGLKSRDEESLKVRALASHVLAFTDNMRVNRLGNSGRDGTLAGSSYKRILSNFETVRESERLPLPMKPILEKIVLPFSRMQDDDGTTAELTKGMVAAKWACDHDLIPQGFTLLEEAIIGFVSAVLDFEGRCTEKGRPFDVLARRSVASQLLNGYGDQVFASQFDDVKSKYGAGLVPLFRALVIARNNINHAGTGNDTPPSIGSFKNSLERLVCKFAEMFGVNLGER